MKEANENYNEGSNYLKTSCFKCRLQPDYSSAIPYFKLAADKFHSCGDFSKEIETREKLVKCFKNEKSFWEEGNEYEKISKVQLNQLKSPSDSYNSIENAFNAYINDHKYDYAIKSLSKSSENFIDNEYKKEAEKTLSLGFEGINKYYYILSLDKNGDYLYIYNFLEKYIDLLYNNENYKKGSETSKKIAELIEKKENESENKIIGKFYTYEAIGELLQKKEDKYKKAINKGMNLENNVNGLSSKVNKLVELVNEKNKDNEKKITGIFYDINDKIPISISKMLNKYIKENKIYDEDNNISNLDKITDYEDLK